MPRWTRALLIILPLALLGVLVTAACEEEAVPASSPAQGSVSGARISFEDESVDFGKVPLDKEVRHTFRFKNVGTETLTIRDVRVRTVEGC